LIRSLMSVSHELDKVFLNREVKNTYKQNLSARNVMSEYSAFSVYLHPQAIPSELKTVNLSRNYTIKKHSTRKRIIHLPVVLVQNKNIFISDGCFS